MEKKTAEEPRTHKALKACADWLGYCLSIGWEKSQLDALEKIWWQHRDNKGNLIKSKPIREGKPDFEAMAIKFVGRYGLDGQNIFQAVGDSYLNGCQAIWNDYVTPLQSRIKELEDQQRWIPVSERKPEVFVLVLIAGNKGTRALSCVDQSGYIDDYFLKDDEIPTHWQPLPKSPLPSTEKH